MVRKMWLAHKGGEYDSIHAIFRFSALNLQSFHMLQPHQESWSGAIFLPLLSTRVDGSFCLTDLDAGEHWHTFLMLVLYYRINATYTSSSADVLSSVSGFVHTFSFTSTAT